MTPPVHFDLAQYFVPGTFIFLFLIVIAAILSTFFMVEQQTVAIVARFGKFVRAGHAGLRVKIPFIDRVVGRMSLRVLQLDVPVETKTKDNVFLKLSVSVQYRVKDTKVFDAFYKLSQPDEQIMAFIFDVVRAQVPKLTLDDVFEKKDNIAVTVKSELTEQMEDFGYDIIKALVIDIDPDGKVKTAMNEINEQQRLRVAAEQRGEAEKVIRVKKAEAEAESLRLLGQGVADQRRAIIDGLKESVEQFQKGAPGVSALDVMNLVLATQYYDALKEIGATNKSSTILLSGVPDGTKAFANLLQESVLTANIASKDV
jgi:regulator of protease activity HflC (stomatin/prohibitin superfamily)